jgi:hypothetical protein
VLLRLQDRLHHWEAGLRDEKRAELCLHYQLAVQLGCSRAVPGALCLVSAGARFSLSVSRTQKFKAKTLRVLRCFRKATADVRCFEKTVKIERSSAASKAASCAESQWCS